jgi:hypothetical protein
VKLHAICVVVIRLELHKEETSARAAGRELTPRTGGAAGSNGGRWVELVTNGLLRTGVWLLVLLPCVAKGQGRWPDERRAGLFQCHADFPLDSHPNLLDELARLQRDLVRTLEVGETAEPIHLFLFERRSTYDSYLRLHFPEVPERRALFIKERGPGMVFAFRSPEFEVDVRHEGTHALLHAELPMVPLWLDEGLAEYFEVPYADRAFGHPHLAKVRFACRTWLNPPPDLEQLEQLRDLDQMGASEYRAAWAWVHFMLHGSSTAHDELLRYLAEIRAQTPPGQLSQRLRRRIPNLNQEFVEHFRQWKR